MNIFFLDINIRRNAFYYCDKRLIKIILEITQMLWTAYGTEKVDLPPDIKRYKATHVKHPMSLWVRKSQTNFNFTARLGMALCDEYSTRFERTHACERIIQWIYAHPPSTWGSTYAPTTVLASTDIPPHVTPVPLCMPSQYQGPSLVKSYRAYYKCEKRHNATWRHTGQPLWMK
jgi:hypothetical protein